jgi:hypothetical protein
MDTCGISYNDESEKRGCTSAVSNDSHLRTIETSTTWKYAAVIIRLSVDSGRNVKNETWRKDKHRSVV